MASDRQVHREVDAVHGVLGEIRDHEHLDELQQQRLGGHRGLADRTRGA
jgi:hypothetical protein